MAGVELNVAPLRGQQTSQILLQWIVVLLGILAALTVPVACHDVWVGEDPAKPFELTVISQALGVSLLALVFAVSSLVSLRNRRSAGVLFLAGGPVPSFLLAYASAGYVVQSANGEAAYRLPSLLQAVGAAVVFYLPFLATVVAIRRRKRVGQVFGISAVPIGVLLGASHWIRVFVPPLAGWSALPVVFGAFWMGTDRLGWPGLFPRRGSRTLTTLVTTGLLICVLAVGGSFDLTVLRSSLWTPDCSGPRLFTRPSRAEEIVLTARMLRTAHTQKVGGSWAGSWAIAIVEERFWGLPSWARIVLLTDGMFWEGRTYFVSGFRGYGMVARVLPVVDATSCGRHYAVPLADAKVELRLLHEKPPVGEARIVGRVLGGNSSSWNGMRVATAGIRRPFASWRNHQSREVYEWGLTGPRTHHPIPGARIRLTGPSGTTVLTADQDGVYEAPRLSAGEYTLHLLDVPAYQFSRDLTLKRETLDRSGALQMDVIANWMGSIEGTVRDANGSPVEALVELRNPDGSEADRSLGGYRVAKNGAFRFETLPAGGRYLVLVNRFGPSVDLPYPSLYYPAARRPEGACVFEVRGGEAIGGVDFHVARLPERIVSVRAAWPDGRPVEDGSISVVNVQPEGYDDLGAPAGAFSTNQNGVAEVRVVGDGRVRLQASTSNPEETEPPFSSYSRPVVFETRLLPASLNLVVPFAATHRSR